MKLEALVFFFEAVVHQSPPQQSSLQATRPKEVAKERCGDTFSGRNDEYAVFGLAVFLLFYLPLYRLSYQWVGLKLDKVC